MNAADYGAKIVYFKVNIKFLFLTHNLKRFRNRKENDFIFDRLLEYQFSI